ncbi:hypothetical protein HKD37_18G051075 [Glycine soja]
MTGERSMFLDLNLVEGGTISFGGIGMGNITGIGKIDIPSLASMKEQMTTMMEAMMDTRKIMEVNATAAATAYTTTKRDLTHPPIFNQESHLVSDVGGQGGVAGVVAYGPQYTQSHNRYIFPPYGLPPNYTPPMVVPVPAENVTNLIPVCTENHQTQPDQTQAYNSNAMEEAQEAPIDHTITGFKPHPGYIAEGHAFSGVLVLNTLGASQYRPLSQPLHFMRGEGAPAVVRPGNSDLVFAGERIKVGLKKGKFDYATSTNSGSMRLGMNGVKKREGEAQVVAMVPTWTNFPQAPYNPMYQVLDRRLQEDWARAAKEGPGVLMNLRVDFLSPWAKITQVLKKKKERKPQEANINLPYFHGEDNVEANLDWEIRIEQQLKRKSTSKSYDSHSYPKKDQGQGILGVTPSKPKDDKGKTIEKQPLKASMEEKTSFIKCFKCLGRRHITSQCPTKKIMIMKDQDIYNSQDEATTSPSSSESEEAKGEESSEEIYPQEEGQPLMVKEECKEVSVSSKRLAKKESHFEIKTNIKEVSPLRQPPHLLLCKTTLVSTAIPLGLKVIPQVKELLDEGLVRKSLNPYALLVPKIGVEGKSPEYKEPQDLRSNPFQGGGDDAIIPPKDSSLSFLSKEECKEVRVSSKRLAKKESYFSLKTNIKETFHVRQPPHFLLCKKTLVSIVTPLGLEVIPQVKELLDAGLVHKSLNPCVLLVPKIGIMRHQIPMIGGMMNVLSGATLFCKITHASNIFMIHIHRDSLGRFVLIFSFNTNLGAHMGHLRFVYLFGRNNQHENTEKGVEGRSPKYQEPWDLRLNPFQGGNDDAILPPPPRLKQPCNIVMQSYPTRALDRRLQEDWARDAREGPRILMSLKTHLLLEVASPIIFLPSPFCCHDLQEAKDSIDEEDPRPTSSNGATSCGIRASSSRKSTSKSYGSHSYPKKDQGQGILGVTPSKPKDDKGKTIEKQPLKASIQEKTSSMKCFKCLGRGHITSQCPTKKIIIMRGQYIYSSRDEATTSPSSSESEEAKGEESSEEIYPQEEGQPLMDKEECKDTLVSIATPLRLEFIPQVKELLDEGLVRKSLNPYALFMPKIGQILFKGEGMMQSYATRALDRRLQEDWARDAREGPRVLMSLRINFGLMG